MSDNRLATFSEGLGDEPILMYGIPLTDMSKPELMTAIRILGQHQMDQSQERRRRLILGRWTREQTVDLEPPNTPPFRFKWGI